MAAFLSLMIKKTQKRATGADFALPALCTSLVPQSFLGPHGLVYQLLILLHDNDRREIEYYHEYDSGVDGHSDGFHQA
jgi:hypothetical protein